jgi:CO dehydrogenase/acetyl-CoA synthase epsilon subunit
MTHLEEALSRGLRRHRPVLVLGPDRTPSKVTETISRLAKARPVRSCDFRAGLPEQARLTDVLSEGLKNQGVLHIIIGHSLDPRLLDALVSVISDHRLPGADADMTLDGVVVLSSLARFASELAPGLNEYFPIQIGAAE